MACAAAAVWEGFGIVGELSPDAAGTASPARALMTATSQTLTAQANHQFWPNFLTCRLMTAPSRPFSLAPKLPKRHSG